MTLILNGTDNSATTPAVTGTDTDTGIYYPTSNQVAIATNGTQAMLVDASQNVGIGNTAPSTLDQVGAVRPLTVSRSDTNTTVNGSLASITIANSDTTTNNTAQINFAASSGANTNFYSSAAISTIFGARTNGQYATGQLVFSTSTVVNSAPTEKMRITNNGTVILAGGSTSATGVGITFPATQSASSDVNTLDDYEEGTFTPTITGTSPAGTATYTNQIGKYTKIGDRVLVNVYLSWSGGTGGGQMNISGLPFASDNQITLASYNANIAMTAGHVMQTITNSTLININSVPSGGGSDANVPYDASGLLIIGGSYKV
jgi:hypothetical protein